MAKDFYSQKFGDGTMSASKVKEMFNDESRSNMNGVMRYEVRGTRDEGNTPLPAQEQVSPLEGGLTGVIGFCLCYVNDQVIHYAYPFYRLDIDFPNLGMGMMIRAVQWAKENDKRYIYLGSIVDETALYKLQFNALEWFDTDEHKWSDDIDLIKGIVKENV